MITHAESAEFLSDVQTMIDLDFSDQLDPSRFERLTYVPEDVWADFGDHAEDVYSDEGGEDAAMEGHLFGWDA